MVGRATGCEVSLRARWVFALSALRGELNPVGDPSLRFRLRLAWRYARG
jgi:hypothetical protein